jgi:hypothetical protein
MMEGVNSSVKYLIHLRTFVNATVYPHSHNDKNINEKHMSLEQNQL